MIALDEGCVCGSIGAHVSDVRMCVARDANGNDHHRYWRGDQELLSVSHVLKSTWPFKPGFRSAPPHVVGNARLRGVVVDRLFSGYVNGELTGIPVGTRLDSLRLFWRLKRWWSDHKHGEVRAQVILADDAIAGTCDILDDATIYDLKTTYSVDEPLYELQLAAYSTLFYATFGRQPKKAALIHLTERYPAPKLKSVDLVQGMIDWATWRDTYMMAKRRTKRA